MYDTKRIYTKKIKDWAKKDTNIQSIIIIGSTSRELQKGDRYSDIDIIVFANNINRYKKQIDWIYKICNPISFYDGLEVSKGIFVKRVFFENEVAVDITILKYSSLLLMYLYAFFFETIFIRMVRKKKKKQIENKILHFTYYLHRGFYFIMDKKDSKNRINKILQKFCYKTEFSFELNNPEIIIHRFWQNAYRMAVKLKRNELFTARIECECPMKKDLLSLIELYTKYKKGDNFETWHKGRYIEKWADPLIVKRLEFVYDSNNIQNTWKSLINTINLFKYVSSLIEKSPKFILINNPQAYFNKWIIDIKNKCEHEENFTIKR